MTVNKFSCNKYHLDDLSTCLGLPWLLFQNGAQTPQLSLLPLEWVPGIIGVLILLTLLTMVAKISIPKLHMFFFHVPSDQRIRSIYVCSLFLTDSMSFIHKMLDKYLLNLIHKTSVLLLHSHTIYCYRKNFNFIFFSKTEIEIDFSSKAENPKKKNVLSLYTVLCLSQYKEVSTVSFSSNKVKYTPTQPSLLVCLFLWPVV